MRRIHIPENVTHRYRLLPPSGSNKSFRVMRLNADKWQTIKNDSINSINKQFRDGTLTAAEARNQLGLAIEALYKADGVKVSRVESNSENQKLVDRYFETVIQLKKTDADSKEKARHYLNRAISALGEHSLLAADIDSLQNALDERYPDQRQRRLVTALNSVLKWAGREDVKLQPHGYIPPDVKYIPFEKIDSVLARIEDPHFKILVQMALYTGLRIGELMALEHKHLKRKEGGIYVEWQIRRSGKRALPKHGKRRTVAVFNEALALYEAWLESKPHIDSDTRKFASKFLKSACRRAFPNRSEWHLRFHDLRHSYAIKCFDQGMSLEWVAKQLGNRIEVTEKHYVGFVQTTNTLEAAFKILNKGRKVKVAKAG